MKASEAMKEIKELDKSDRDELGVLCLRALGRNDDGTLKSE